MKLIMLFFLLCFKISYSQDNDNTFYCSYFEADYKGVPCRTILNSFGSNQEAESIVSQIIEILKVRPNFVIIPCTLIPKAMAYLGEKDQIRYILYNNDFMDKIVKKTSYWSNVSILAHEIGHHLYRHTIDRKLSTELINDPNELLRSRELVADEFSGYIMFKLGANLQQSGAALIIDQPDFESAISTHPRLSKRLRAVENGFNKAKQNQALSIPDSESPENLYNLGNFYFDNNDFIAAIDKYSEAINLNNRFINAIYNRGLSRLNLDETNVAFSDFQRVLALDSNYEYAYFSLGYIESKSGNLGNALEKYSKAIELNPDFFLAYYNRGIIKEKLGYSKKSYKIDYKKANELKYYYENK